MATASKYHSFDEQWAAIEARAVAARAAVAAAAPEVEKWFRLSQAERQLVNVEWARDPKAPTGLVDVAKVRAACGWLALYPTVNNATAWIMTLWGYLSYGVPARPRRRRMARPRRA